MSHHVLFVYFIGDYYSPVLRCLQALLQIKLPNEVKFFWHHTDTVIKHGTITQLC